MQRILPVVAAFALVIVGVGGAILWFASRDHSSLDAAPSSTPAGAPAGAADGPFGLPRGNVVVTYGEQRDRILVDRLAERLGAIDTKASRAAGQALVSKADRDGRVIASTGPVTLDLTGADDPRLANFVRQHLGRVTTP